MKYEQIVVKNSDAFGMCDVFKLAHDLAKILDNSDFQIGESSTWDYSTVGFVELREKAFNKFCATCLAVGVDLPPIEEIFYKVPIFNRRQSYVDEAVVMEQRHVREHVRNQLSGKRSKNAKLCRALQSVMDIFPEPGYGRFDEKKMSSMINFFLAKEGCEVIRPDYANIRINTSMMNEPKIHAKILIVDDDKAVALKTATAIAGWQNVDIAFYFYECKSSFGDLKGDQKEKALSITAQEVLDTQSQIVLMDQGLGDIKGSDLIKKMRDMRDISKDTPVFIGNTGGSDSELVAVGTLTNCNKGASFVGMNHAMSLLK